MSLLTKKITLSILLLISLSLAVLMATIYMGWFVIVFWWGFIILILFHLFSHIYFLWNINVYEKYILRKVFLSHMLFLLVFLLKPDISDARGTWITLLLVIGQLFSGIKELLWHIQENEFWGYANAYIIFYLFYIAFFIFYEIRFIRFTRRLLWE